MSGVSDRQVPKETLIRPQNVVLSKPHLPPCPDHAPRPPVPAPWALSREEVGRHILQPFCSLFRRNFLPPPIPLRLQKIQIKLSCHQNFGAPVFFLEHGNDTLYCLGVVGVSKPHLPPCPDHAPRPPVPAPWALSREEVGRHILQPFCSLFRRNFLPPPIPLRLQKIQIKLSCHQNFGAPVFFLEHGNDTLYRLGVVGGELTSNDLTSPLPCRQLEANDVGPELLDGLHRKKRWWPIEDCNPAAVPARCIRCDNTVPG